MSTTAYHDPIIGAVEAAIRRCAHLLRPEQRDHAIAEARAAFVKLRTHVDEMREHGASLEYVLLRMAAALAIARGNGESDFEVVEQFKMAYGPNRTEDAEWTRKP